MDVTNQNESTTQTLEPTATETAANIETVKNPEAVLAKNRDLLAQLKKQKEQLSGYEEADKARNLDKEQAKGNYEGVISALRDELKEVKGRSADSDKKYAFNRFSEQIKSAAVKEHCKNPDTLMKLLSVEQMKSVEIDGDFNVNADDLKRLLDEVKEQYSDIKLFDSGKVNINHVTGTPRQESKNVEPQTKQDIIAQLRNL